MTDAVRPGTTVDQVRDQVRHAILSGELPPGTQLSAVQLAIRYGVSRTPVREAIRLLQEQGLIVSEGNRRPRVATITPDELEGLYAQRVMLYSLGTMLTVPLLSAEELDHMQALYQEMIEAAERDDVLGWRKWAFPLMVVGMNSMAAYLIAHLWEHFLLDSFRIHLGARFFRVLGVAPLV